MFGSHQLGQGSVPTSGSADAATGTPGGPFPGFATTAPPNVGSESQLGTSPLVARGDHTHGAVQADWAIANVRWYALDAAAPDDSARGFSDVSEAAAGLVAKQTLLGLGAIIPRLGCGRAIEISIAAGTYTGGLDRILMGLEGYSSIRVHGTGTQANAGAVKFAGDAATNLFCGGITVPGLNAAGYNATGAPTTTVIQCVLNGGGAPALPAEPAAPLGWRIRFDAATPTVALRGICKTLCRVTGTDTITVNTALPAVPVVVGVGADIFYIEKAGVLVDASTLAMADDTNVNIAGIDVVGQLRLLTGRLTMAFCGATSYTAENPTYLVCSRIARMGSGPLGSNVAVGGGLRVAGTVTNGLGGGQGGNLTGFVATGAAELVNPGLLMIGDACVFAAGVFINGGTGGAGTSDPADGIGFTGTVVPMRITGPGALAGLFLRGTRCTTRVLDISGCGAKPAIMVEGETLLGIRGALSGTTGNTDVGLDLTNARNSVIALYVTPTVTGTAGDVRLAGGQIVTWAAVAATGIVDSAGNRILSAVAPLVSAGLFTGMITPNEDPEHSYMANGGRFAVSAEPDPMRYPTSLRLMMRLRVTWLTDNATACTVTLYKNGVATAMTVAIAAGAGVRQFVDSAHPILFADGDDYDLRIDAEGDADADQKCSAQLEQAA